MDLVNSYFNLFEKHLISHPLTRNPVNLYAPADYILSLGGKRLRPVFVLLGYDLFGKNIEKALNAALAIEIFHNFTLVHDDVMDNAHIRRGSPTVHIKYNVNTAILSGDAMMIQAYQYILDYQDPALVKSLMDIFNKMAFEVCEGQQLDMDFENESEVSIDDYLHMITLKTSVLIASAIQIGALLGGAESSDQKHLYEFAKNFGIAFQLQDDVLDTFGLSDVVGKKIGGDIIQNKKTYLFLKSLELSDSPRQKKLRELYSSVLHDSNQQKIEEVTAIFNAANVREYANQLIEVYRDLAVSHLKACNIDETKKNEIIAFVNQMIYRQS